MGGDCACVWAEQVGAVNNDSFFCGDGRFDFGVSFFELCVAAVLWQADGSRDVAEAVEKSRPGTLPDSWSGKNSVNEMEETLPRPFIRTRLGLAFSTVAEAFPAVVCCAGMAQETKARAKAGAKPAVRK
jgi:hypothetical protein